MRPIRLPQVPPFVLVLIILPLVANYMMYFTVGHHYSGLDRSFEEIHAFYHSTLFRYRLIGIEMVRWTYEGLLALGIGTRQYPHMGGAQGTVIWAFYLVNTFYNILTAILFYGWIRNPNQGRLTEKEVQLYTMVVIFMVSITQFVVTPYDSMGYFFLVLLYRLGISYLAEPAKTRLPWLLWLGIFLATLVRETSVLALLGIFTWGIHSFSLRILVRKMGPLFVIFTLTYLGIRWALGSGAEFVDLESEVLKILHTNFLTVSGWAGLTFLGIGNFWIFHQAHSTAQQQALWKFWICCIPYFLVCSTIGLWYEMRLSVPIFLIGLLLVLTSSGPPKESPTTTD